MSTALSGMTAELGTNVRYGVIAAFNEANQQGGIQGRTLKLVALDDRYEPTLTTPNMRRLIEQENVLAVIGNVGTPTAIAALPLANSSGTPMFGTVSGAAILRKTPPDRFVMNFRASYAEETQAMVKSLLESGIAPEEIAFFTQNDSFGDDGFFGALAAIREHSRIQLSELAHGRYTRNTLNVESGLANILLHRPFPKAVIMVGTYGPCAKMIRLARQNGFNPIFLGISFVNSDALQRELGTNADGIIVSQVVPHYLSDAPIVVQYRAAMENMDSDLAYTFASLEGYVSATVLIKALRQIEGEITRETINNQLEQLEDFDIGLGQSLHLSSTNHQASHHVWPMRLRAVATEPLNWEDIHE